MIFELSSGFLAMTIVGVYQYWNSDPTVPLFEPEEPEPLTLYESLVSTKLEDLFNNWVAILLSLLSTLSSSVGVFLMVRRNRKVVNAEFLKSQQFNFNQYENEPGFDFIEFGLEKGLESGEDDLEFCEAGNPLENNAWGEQDLDGTLASTRMGEENVENISDAESCTPRPASFLPDISGQDKAKVDRILNAQSEIGAGNSFAEDDDSIFCGTSLSSKGGTNSPNNHSHRDLQPGQFVISNDNNRTPCPMPQLTSKGSSFGDVLLNHNESFKPELGSNSNPAESAKSKLSSHSNHGSQKESKKSKIPVAGKKSCQKGNVRQTTLHMSTSGTETSVKVVNSGKTGSIRSVEMCAQKKGVVGDNGVNSRHSYRRLHVTQDSGKTPNEIPDLNYESSGSEESEVSIQSLLDQSEISMLTSSAEEHPSPSMPGGFSSQKGLTSLLRSMKGKSVDEQFNALWNVIQRQRNDINLLLQAEDQSSHERVRSVSRGRRRTMRDKRASPTVQTRKNAKSCPRGVTRDRLTGSLSGNTFSNEQQSSSNTAKSYMMGNYFAMYGGNYSYVQGQYVQGKNLGANSSRLKNPPMRFGKEDKTVFMAAGHYRPSDLEIIRQKKELKPVGNLALRKC